MMKIVQSKFWISSSSNNHSQKTKSSTSLLCIPTYCIQNSQIRNVHRIYLLGTKEREIRQFLTDSIFKEHYICI